MTETTQDKKISILGAIFVVNDRAFVQIDDKIMRLFRLGEGDILAQTVSEEGILLTPSLSTDKPTELNESKEEGDGDGN